jgi:phosphoglycolate phosphatase
MIYKLVIFDVDGTLADSFPWFLSVFTTLAERYRYKAERYRYKRLTEQEGTTLRGLSARQIIQHLGIPAWKLPFIARHARVLAKRDRAQIALFPGVDRMLAQLVAASGGTTC